ncbi:MAG: serine/threonine-protein kinase [Thermosynechococcaceae cyanobacterium]
MSLCINPNCNGPPNSDEELFCRTCGAEILLEGRYRVLRLLGEGGCGRTYEVSDLNGIAKVLKVLTRNEPKYVELFNREAQVLSQLHHPGIPAVEPNAYFKVHLPKATESLYCLVMEKITGLDLRKYLQQRGSPIDQVLAVQWLIQLAQILQAVHGQQILHRDIKPSNIMLKSDGHLALIDFGTVRTITNVFADNPETQATRIVSALYTPNEQMKGKPVPQSDFFALGRTFVYLLTGRDLSDLYDPDSDTLNWRTAVPTLSVKFGDFLDQMMAPLAAQRHANAEIILLQLTNIQRDFLASSAVLTPTQWGNAPTQLAPHRQGGLPPVFTPHALNSVSPPPPANRTAVGQNPPLPPRISPDFMGRCQKELAEFIGPIASIICRRTLTQFPQISEAELVEALAQKIPNRQDAQTFRQRLRF